jgi:hypothetical protein
MSNPPSDAMATRKANGNAATMAMGDRSLVRIAGPKEVTGISV